MKKNIIKLALVSLAFLATSFAPTSDTIRPEVRIAYYNNLELYVFAGQPFTFEIIFKNTDRLLVFSNYNYYEEIELNILQKNMPMELSLEYTTTIYEYEYEVEYTVIAESKDHIQDFAHITLITRPNLDI